MFCWAWNNVTITISRIITTVNSIIVWTRV